MTFLAAAAPAFSAISTLASVAGTVMSGLAASQAASYQAAVASRNAELARINANNARQAGNQQAQNQDLKTRGLIGSQLAAQGASGLTIGEGSLGSVVESTARLGRYDTLQTKFAAEKQAVDYENQAGSFDAQAQLERLKAGNTMTAAWVGGLGSLASGAASVGAKYAQLTNAGMRVWNPLEG